MELLV